MSLNRDRAVREQYRDSSRLTARVNLHARYSTNPIGWPVWIFDKLDLRSGERVLEVGCGPGWLWRGNLERVPSGCTIVASDFSYGMASEAKEHLGGLEVLSADAQALPFDDASFDVLVANHMLYHVPDLDAALSEFARVLRPSGRLFAAANGGDHFHEVRDILGTHWRYIDVFGLESGPDRIASYFDDVAVERYDDAIESPEADPVVAYVLSMTTFWNLDDDRIADFRRQIDEEIARNGVFHISKDAGVITATRR